MRLTRLPFSLGGWPRTTTTRGTVAGPHWRLGCHARRRWLAALWLALVPLLSTARELEIIPLQHRLVAEVLPLLRPLLAPDGTLTGNGNQLIIRTTPANLAEIKLALAGIDIPLARLRIAVAQARNDQPGVSGSGGWVRYRVTGAASELALGTSSVTTQGRDDQQVVQSVLTMDGQPAYINVGQITPVPVVLGYGLAPGALVGIGGSSLQTASTGFYVTPHLRQDSVWLSLDSRLERFVPDGSNTITSNTSSVNLSARLGEWVVVGGSSQRGGLNTSDYQLLIRVERVP